MVFTCRVTSSCYCLEKRESEAFTQIYNAVMWRKDNVNTLNLVQTLYVNTPGIVTFLYCSITPVALNIRVQCKTRRNPEVILPH